MTVCTDTAAPAEATAVSIYEAIGGRAAVTAAVGPRHRAYLVTVLGEALGGPERYRGPDLAKAHGGLGITDADFDRTAGHLAATLDSLGVPGHLADQIIGIVAGLRPV